MKIQIGTRTINIFKNDHGPGNKGTTGINITRSPEDRKHNWYDDLVGLDLTPDQAIQIGNELVRTGERLGNHDNKLPDICGDCHHYVPDCVCEDDSCEKCGEPFDTWYCCETCWEQYFDCICPGGCQRKCLRKDCPPEYEYETEGCLGPHGECPFNVRSDWKNGVMSMEHEDDDYCDYCDELYGDCTCIDKPCEDRHCLYEDTCEDYCCKSCGDRHDLIASECLGEDCQIQCNHDEDICDGCDELYENCYCDDMCDECGCFYDDCECYYDNDDCEPLICGKCHDNYHDCGCEPYVPVSHEVVAPPLDAFHRARYLKTQG